MTGKIPVLETFLTIQGEGMVAGRKTVFVRTAGCDYACSWCDSSFTWDGTAKEDIRMLTPYELYNELKEKFGGNFNHVTISGGNPALIGQPMNSFIFLLHEGEIQVGLETQGSRFQDWFYSVDDLTISPKPPSSGMLTDFNMLDDIVVKLTRSKDNVNFTFKVVVFDDIDFDYAKLINERYNPEKLFLSVGNIDSNEGGDISGRLLDRTEWLWDKVIADKEMNNAIPLPQIHALLYGNRRGV